VEDNMDRYLRNKPLIAEEEQKKLLKSKVVVLGVGGLGGYIAEMLARVGVGVLTLVDYDKFEGSNLNRQIFSNENNIGNSKVEEGKKRINIINQDVEVRVINKKITPTNIQEIISGNDVVVDALDSSSLKKLVERSCNEVKIPMVHGAIGGFVGQVAVIMPGNFILDKIYGEKEVEGKLGNPSFTPGVIASIQVGEVVKLLLNKGKNLRKEILYIDLENNDFTKIPV
jgi:molybdopterin/thiamine biosynthesis adenylyltransferase